MLGGEHRVGRTERGVLEREGMEERRRENGANQAWLGPEQVREDQVREWCRVFDTRALLARRVGVGEGERRRRGIGEREGGREEPTIRSVVYRKRSGECPALSILLSLRLSPWEKRNARRPSSSRMPRQCCLLSSLLCSTVTILSCLVVFSLVLYHHHRIVPFFQPPHRVLFSTPFIHELSSDVHAGSTSCSGWPQSTTRLGFPLACET